MPKKKVDYSSYEQKLNNIIDNFITWFKNLFSKERSTDEVIDIFLSIVAMFILLWLLKIPFVMINALGEGLISLTFSPLDKVVTFIWEVVVQLIYLIFALFIIVTIFKRIFSSKREVKKENKVIIEEKKETSKVVEQKSYLYNTIRVIIRLLIVIFMIPFVLFNIGLFIILGVLIGLWIKGTVLIGAVFITIGIFLVMSAIMGVILKLLSEGELK